MGTRTTITTRLLALAALLLVPAVGMGAGLGKLALHSALGQELRADIEIVSLQASEAGSLSARIASPEAFREAGVDYGPTIPTLRASLQRRDGNYQVVLTSTQPINEPFLDVLVELNWATGRLVRQYTFLLDPTGYKGPNAPPAVASVEAKPVEAPKAPEPAPAPAAPAKSPEAAPSPITPAPAAETPAPAPAATPAPMAESAPPPAPETPGPSMAAAGGTYEVVKGDTLSQIAVANLPDGVSLNQMLVALYRANEAAFINNNMNLVRAGETLKIPSKEDALAVAREDATKVVGVQAQEFDQYRGRVATAVAMAPAREAPGQRATGKIEAAAPAPAAPKGPAEDQLRLSRAEEASKAGKSAARADDLAARERELKEERERVSQLEQNVKDMERLLELKNQQLAELQKQAAASAVPVMATAAPRAGADKKHDDGKQRDPRASEQRDRERSDTHARTRFADRERIIVREYYVKEYERGHCPLGLARKHNGCMPPGQGKKWRIGHPLPREVIFYDLPPSLVVEIGVPPLGYRYVRVASDILMIAAGTGMVADAIEDLGRM